MHFAIHAVIPGERERACTRVAEGQRAIGAFARGKGTQWLGRTATMQNIVVVLVAVQEPSTPGSPSLT
jgi:hypothetical protein